MSVDFFPTTPLSTFLCLTLSVPLCLLPFLSLLQTRLRCISSFQFKWYRIILNTSSWAQLWLLHCIFFLSASPHPLLFLFLLLSSHADISPPPEPPPTVTDRMAMPVLIRACMARCSARLSAGLWERELLILASGDGLKTTGAKTSKQSLITPAH